MSDYNIRVAVESDAEVIQELMYEAFTPLRELGIDWPSVNANVDLVKKNIITSTTFVLENESEIISTITVRYPWEGKRRISHIHLSGGLLQNRLMMGKVMVVNF